MSTKVRLRTSEIADLIDALVAQNMVVYDEVAGRYELLDNIRAYGQDCFRSSAEQRRLKDGHLRSCMELAEEARKHYGGPDEDRWLDRLDLERDNLRAAINWALSDCSPADPAASAEVLLRTVSALAYYWDRFALYREGQEYCRLAQEHAGAGRHAVLVAGVLAAQGGMLYRMQRLEESLDCHQLSLQMRRKLGDRLAIAKSLTNVGTILSDIGKIEEGVEMLREALGICEELGDLNAVAAILVNIGSILFENSDLEGAQIAFARAQSICTETKNERQLANLHGYLTDLHISIGNWEKAGEHCRESLARCNRCDADYLSLLVSAAEILLAREARSQAAELLVCVEKLALLHELPLPDATHKVFGKLGSAGFHASDLSFEASLKLVMAALGATDASAYVA